MKTDRREFSFLAAGTALSALAPSIALGENRNSAPAQTQTAAADAKPWYTRAKRVGQTNFNDKDPESGDVEKWADYWGSAKVDAVALSVSGPVAFYPTEIPFFHRSPYLNGRDLFGDCVRAAKKRGIRVYGCGFVVTRMEACSHLPRTLPLPASSASTTASSSLPLFVS
jgi:hypothetical protein